MDRFDTFTGAILELNRSIQKLKELEMAPFGLRGSHTMALHHLYKHPEGMTATELTNACREDKGAMSRCLQQLIRQGYVTGSAPEGRRAYRTHLRLTQSGQEVARQMGCRVEAAVFGGGSGLTEDQRSTFYSVLETVQQNLTNYLNTKTRGEPAPAEGE